MKKHLILAYCVLSLPIPLKGFLNTRFVLASPGHSAQIATICGENHCLDETINKGQFNAMLGVIKANESISSGMMIFFLEVPHTNQIIPQDNEIQDPVHGLPHYTKDLNLQKTTIMDCETRKVEGAASILLSFRPERLARLLSFMTPDYDGPHKQFARNCITFFGCRFDTLTFQDLLTDHISWFQRCLKYRFLV